MISNAINQRPWGVLKVPGAAAELLQLPCSRISTWVLATCCLDRA